MNKKISQMTKEEKLQALVEYHACRHERDTVCRYIRALRQEDEEQTAYFEGFGESVHQIILNTNIYERRLIFRLCGQAVQRIRVDKRHVAYCRRHPVRRFKHDTYRSVRKRYIRRHGGLVYRHGRRRQPSFGMGRTHFQL